MTLVNLTLVGIGGFLGAIFRYAISKYLNNKPKSKSLFPLGTLTVNLLGAFLIGLNHWSKSGFDDYSFIGNGIYGCIYNLFNSEVRNDTIVSK